MQGRCDVAFHQIRFRKSEDSSCVSENLVIVRVAGASHVRAPEFVAQPRSAGLVHPRPCPVSILGTEEHDLLFSGPSGIVRVIAKPSPCKVSGPSAGGLGPIRILPGPEVIRKVREQILAEKRRRTH